MFLKEENYSSADIEKTITQVEVANDSVFYVNKLGSFGAFADPSSAYIKLTVKHNNTITVEGKSGTSYTIEDDHIKNQVSYYDPKTKAIYLYSKRTVLSNGSQTLFEEKIVFKGQ